MTAISATATLVGDTFLRTIVADIGQASREAERLASGLGEEELNWSPAPGAWSVAQCLEHLTVTSALYRARLAPAIARARLVAPAAPPNYEATWVGRWLADTLRSSRRRLKAPKAFAVPPRPPAGALGRFLDEQRALAQLAREAEGIDLNRAKLSSPVSALIRLNVGDAFAVLTIHAGRHLRQAERVVEQQRGREAGAGA